ncbi:MULTISPECIES: YolD-like family protein [Exiguobacterium]|uniref:YolD-like family protein n=1 Tax=Exiguobacterium oxidotolerans TaxID=223958 RepID=A0A653I4H6_9BACL|nr:MULTISPECIES: YolD-like family protein [Exiguobacterium]VWX33722.1 conserved hypothetical protein [Exiguobacterium oxidotolerans]
MTRYHDRGNLKWIPFLMPEYIQLLHDYYVESHRLTLPPIDAQLQESWQFVLEEALMEGKELEITYYKEGSYLTLTGFIEQINREQGLLYVRSQKLTEIPLMRLVRIENG